MIGIFTLTLEANESREMAASGEYFELRNVPSPLVLIELMDRTGGVVSRLVSPDQSDYVKPGLFETVRISNGATAQTIRYFFGTGDAGSRRFSGNVSGTVDLSATTLAALESVDLNAATSDIIRRPLSPTGYSNTSGLVTAASTITAVTPAANANGLIVTSASMCDFSSTTFGYQAWLHDAAAPAGVVPASAGVILLMVNNTSATSGQSNLLKEVFIPAGRGLYFISTFQGNNASGAFRGVSWRAL